jgi:hypothetical protein
MRTSTTTNHNTPTSAASNQNAEPGSRLDGNKVDPFFIIAIVEQV